MFANVTFTNNTENLTDSQSRSNETTMYTALPKDDFPLWEVVISAVFMLLLLITIAIGNIFVIVAVNTQRALQQVQNYFLVSLAVADLTIALFVLPFAIANHIIGYWVFGYVFCDFYTTSDLICCTASICNLCAIAIDRYLAITDPINYASRRTKRNILLSIAVVWIVSAVISFPPILGWNDYTDRGPNQNQWRMVCHITTEKGYIAFSAVAAFFLPLVIMSTVYYRIWVAAKDRIRGRRREKANSQATTYLGSNLQGHKTDVSGKGSKNKSIDSVGDQHEMKPRQTDSSSRSDTKSGTSSSNGMNISNKIASAAQNEACGSASVSISSFHVKMHQEKQKINVMRERKAATTLGIVMGLFILCWLPYFLMYVIIPFCECGAPVRQLEAFIVWLGYVNSALNPIVYTIFNKDFRKAFHKLIVRRIPLPGRRH
ncbi:putative G-protein coupled receptor No18 [Saccoglossus kowalevskii]|uniref:Tyramine/octopamine receptor-like n=1 Tax=Saccoglossus kowalevskii TaxID=10224 RepID=A0ABM0H1U8_SACKO|nr:PREDICTED: tyramine/octopamine receptor-like [Saccoglossus kowalevskii]